MDPREVNKLTTLCASLFFLPLIYATLNVDEFNAVNYAVDILKKPVLSGQAASVSVMYLKSRYGQEYQCSLPGIDFTNEDWRTNDDPLSTNADIANLLRPLEQEPCLLKIKDWWTYEFCYGKVIRQYHLEDSKIVSPEIILGYYESEYDWNNETQAENAKNRLQRYHSQYYVNGTKCDVTGELRRTEVRFLCEEGAGYIARVDEPESCRYVLTIHTSHVCHHPYLKPVPNNKPQPVSCNPVLSPDEYEAYLQHEEEVERLAKEKRMEWLSKQEERLEQAKEQRELEKALEEAKEKNEKEVNKEGETTVEDVTVDEKTEKDDSTTPDENLDTSGALKAMQAKIEKQLLDIAEKDTDEVPMDDTRKDAFMKLASTLNSLLKKLDQAEKDITQTTKTLDKVRQQIQGVEEESNKEETKTDEVAESKDERVKVRVSYGNKRRLRALKEKEIDADQRAGIESAIKNKLQESGLDTNGRRIQVKIIAAEYDGNSEDEDVHVLTDEETKHFQRLIITFLAGNQEAADEMEKQRSLEENYRFVWGNSKGSKTVDEDDD